MVDRFKEIASNIEDDDIDRVVRDRADFIISEVDGVDIGGGEIESFEEIIIDG
jgi:hypothetical protein